MATFLLTLALLTTVLCAPTPPLFPQQFYARYNMTVTGFPIPDMSEWHYDLTNSRMHTAGLMPGPYGDCNWLYLYNNAIAYAWFPPMSGCSEVGGITAPNFVPTYIHDNNATYSGTKTINGILCEEWVAYGYNHTANFWFYTSADARRVPVRHRWVTDMQGDIENVDYFDFQPGPQDPKHFEIPAVCNHSTAFARPVPARVPWRVRHSDRK